MLQFEIFGISLVQQYMQLLTAQEARPKARLKISQ